MPRKSTEIRCSVCGKGNLGQKLVDHDVGELLDMKRVVVHNMPALVCTKCGSVNLYGGILDQIALLLAVSILQQQELDRGEVRYLRKLIGDTQEELAERLGVARATVNRWENNPESVKGPDAYAIRSHAFFRLRDRSAAIEAVASTFTTAQPRPRPRRRGYDIDGATLQSAG
jgi:YgiT-type zinc finger domain-containing protein